MQLIKKTILILIIFNISSCKAQQLNDKLKIDLAYDLINYHYLNADTVKLIRKTISIKDDTMIGLDDSHPDDFYESIIYLHDKPLVKSIEIDTLFNKFEKELINQKFFNLSKGVKLKKIKLKNPKILMKNINSWEYGYDQITFPFHIESKGIIYTFLLKKQSIGGGDLYIYRYKNKKWEELYYIPLYVN